MKASRGGSPSSAYAVVALVVTVLTRRRRSSGSRPEGSVQGVERYFSMMVWSEVRWVEVNAEGMIQLASGLSSMPNLSKAERVSSSFSFAFLKVAVRISSLEGRMTRVVISCLLMHHQGWLYLPIKGAFGSVSSFSASATVTSP